MPDNPSKVTESLEKELLNALRFSGLEKEHLNELVRIVVEVSKAGLDPQRVFPIGVPRIDRLQVQAFVEIGRLSSILNRILTETPRLCGVSVFPYGIPRPTMFQVNIDVGEPVQAQNAVRAAIAA